MGHTWLANERYRIDKRKKNVVFVSTRALGVFIKSQTAIHHVWCVQYLDYSFVVSPVSEDRI
jgi:hypothetical protein